MAAKVFVTTASAVGPAATRTAESTALRDSPNGGSTASGFSTAMSAAARIPASPDNSGEAPAAGSDAARAANLRAGTAGSAAKSGGTDCAAGADGNEQAMSAAVMMAEADATTVDASTVTAAGKAPDKTSGKLRQASTDASSTVATDAATLAMLLAASGMQIDGRAGTEQPSAEQSTIGQPITGRPSGEGGGSRNDDNSARQVAAAGTLAANVALAALTAPATISQALVQDSGAVAGGSVKSLTSAVVAPASADRSTRAVLDSLATSSTLDDQDATASPLLQDKSAAGDTLLAQPGTASASSGLPEMIRGLTPAPLQTAGVERAIALPVTDRNWSEGLAAQVQWQVNNNVQSATLQLSPEHLGPLEVRIDVQPSQVNVSFTASHPDTRSALEQSVPRLREILANGGLTLGQATVQQEARSASQYVPSVSRNAIGASPNVDPVPVSPIRSIGLIDEYA